MTVYKINDWGDQVSMKLTVDWSHPDTEAGIREMSMFWSGHPEEDAPIKRHFKFVVEVMASRAYSFSREDHWGFSPDRIHELVFDSEGFCGSDKPWIKLHDFEDDTTELSWEMKEVEEGGE